MLRTCRMRCTAIFTLCGSARFMNAKWCTTNLLGTQLLTLSHAIAAILCINVPWHLTPRRLISSTPLLVLYKFPLCFIRQLGMIFKNFFRIVTSYSILLIKQKYLYSNINNNYLARSSDLYSIQRRLVEQEERMKDEGLLYTCQVSGVARETLT